MALHEGSQEPNLDVTLGSPLHVSPYERCNFRALTLSNGLQVLLVSDTYSTQGAASLLVEAGSFSDPTCFQGLANFVRGMVIRATAAYPDEPYFYDFLDDYEDYGSSSTEHERTVFSFEVRDDNSSEESNLHEALHRFAQCFIAPLFTKSDFEKEIENMEAKHQENSRSEMNRLTQVMKTNANINHPFHMFSAGSRKSLVDNAASALQESGLLTREAMLEFHRKYYSANLMKLCILGPYELDQLQSWATAMFSDIPNHNTPHPSKIYRGIEPFLPKQRGQVTKVNIMKDSQWLVLSWNAPLTLEEESRTRLGLYITRLLNYRSKGTIVNALRRKGWVEDLEVNQQNHFQFTLFQMKITLKEEGSAHIDEIVGMIYYYINLIKESGLQATFYKEELALAGASFRFREVVRAITMVSKLAFSMCVFSEEDYLSSIYLYQDLHPLPLKEILGHLTPQNCHIYVGGNFKENQTDQTEEWYGTGYHVESIPEFKLHRWRTYCGTESFSKDLHLPEPNPFVPTTFELVSGPLPKDKEDTEGPTLVFRNECMEVHHKLDRFFRVPKTNIEMQMQSPAAFQSPLHEAMTLVFIKLWEESLSEHAPSVERSGSTYRVGIKNAGIRVMIRGYSDCIRILLASIVRKMISIDVNNEQFEESRDEICRSMAKGFRTGTTIRADSYCMKNLRTLLQHPSLSVSMLANMLCSEEFTLTRFRQFSKELVSRMHITALVFGNTPKEDAVSLVQSVQTMTGYQPVQNPERLICWVPQPPIGRDVYVRQACLNTEDSRSATFVKYLVGPKGDCVTDMSLEILFEIMDNSLAPGPGQEEAMTFNDDVDVVNYVRGIGLGFRTSTPSSPEEQLRRIDETLARFRQDILGPMNEEEFEEYVQVYAVVKRNPDFNISQSHRSLIFFHELVYGYRNYKTVGMEASTLLNLRKEDVVDFFDAHIKEGGRNRMRCVAQIYGTQELFDQKPDIPDGAIEVQDVMEWRKEQTFFPFPHPDGNCKVVLSKQILPLW